MPAKLQNSPFKNCIIAKYWNRGTGIKLLKQQKLYLDVTPNQLIIKSKQIGVGISIQKVQDSILIYDIQKLQQKQSEGTYVLVKIKLSNFDESKAITFRFIDIKYSKKVLAVVRQSIQRARNVSNYIDIQSKKKAVYISILHSETQYNQVYQKLKGSFNEPELIQMILEDHPKIKEFNLLKNLLKYQKQKEILIQNLKISEKQQKNNIDANHYSGDLSSFNASNNSQKYEGYSKIKQLQGYHISEQDKNIVISKKQKQQEEDLIINSFRMNQDKKQFIFQDYNLFDQHKSKMNIQAMEIQNQQQKSLVKRCQKMKIPRQKQKQIKLEQKKPIDFQKPQGQYFNMQKTSNSEGRDIRKTIILTKLFYKLLRIPQKYQRQLNAIQQSLFDMKQCRYTHPKVLDMILKTKTHYLSVKRKINIF